MSEDETGDKCKFSFTMIYKILINIV